MNARTRAMLGERGIIILLALTLSLPLAFGALASLGHHSNGPESTSTSLGATTNKGKQAPQAGGDAGVQAGTESCPLPDGVDALSGDLTHGDYVRLWARWAAEEKRQGANADLVGAQVAAAAASDCGQPDATPSTEAPVADQTQSPGKSLDGRSHKDDHRP